MNRYSDDIEAILQADFSNEDPQMILGKKPMPLPEQTPIPDMRPPISDAVPAELQQVAPEASLDDRRSKFEQLLAQAKQQDQGAMPDIEKERAELEKMQALKESMAQPGDMGDARSERDRLQRQAALFRAFGQIIEGGARSAGAKVDVPDSAAQYLEQRAKQSTGDVREDQEMKMRQEKQALVMDDLRQKLASNELDFQNEQAINDPNSPQSQFVQDQFIKMQQVMGKPVNEEMVRSQTSKTLYQVSPWMQKVYSDQLKMKMQGRSQALQERSVAAREDRNNILREKEQGVEGRFGRNLDWKKEEKDELSDKQTEEILGYDEALKLTDDAEKFKKIVDTGLGTSIENTARGMVGKEHPEVAKLKMALGEQLAKKVKTLSGTAASDKEREFIAGISLPTLKDDDDVFQAKLDRARETLKQARQLRIDSYRKQGKNPDNFENKEPDTKGQVKMKIPDGRIKLIPKDQVDAATKAGAVEVE